MVLDERKQLRNLNDFIFGVSPLILVAKMSLIYQDTLSIFNESAVMSPEF